MIHPLCKQIIADLKIDRFVETGTYTGETVSIVSHWLQAMDPDFGVVASVTRDEYLNQFLNNGRRPRYPVFRDSRESARVKLYSVDVDEKRQKGLQSIFSSNPNIRIINSSSEKFLKTSIDTGLFGDNHRMFFYLDAHWGVYWPLRDEIREVLRLKRSVIVIDDFAVPFHPDAGFDVYRFRSCSWFHIRDLFKDRLIHVYYPNRPNMDGQGSVFIFVGYDKGELAFMDQLPCFCPLIRGEPVVPALRIARHLCGLVMIPVLRKIGMEGLYGSLMSLPKGKAPQAEIDDEHWFSQFE